MRRRMLPRCQREEAEVEVEEVADEKAEEEAEAEAEAEAEGEAELKGLFNTNAGAQRRERVTTRLLCASTPARRTQRMVRRGKTKSARGCHDARMKLVVTV
jgi:hypothetical protein